MRKRKTKNNRKNKVHQHKQMSKAKKKKERKKEERKGKTITPTASFIPLLMAMAFFLISLLIWVPVFLCNVGTWLVDFLFPTP